MTPQEAADRAKVSRRTIMLAIEGKTLKALRNNKNQWQIEEEELQRWMESRKPKRKAIPDSSSDNSSDAITEIIIQNKALQVELAMTKQQLDEVKHDRDAWKSQAQNLAVRKRFFGLF